MSKEVDLSQYNFTEEEKLIIEHEYKMREEKRKMFFAITIMMTICLTFFAFQLILLFKFIIGRPTFTITSVTSYIIIAFVAIVLTLFSILPLILSIFCMGSTNKIIKRVSLAYMISCIVIMILNIVYIVYFVIKLLSLIP